MTTADELDSTHLVPHDDDDDEVSPSDEASTSLDLTQHFRMRTVVIPEAKVLFVPVPKSGCSSIMWALADAARIDRGRFNRSRSIQPTPDLTIHDMDVWGPEHRLAERGEDEILELLEADGWFRFTVVREPIARLWSAWQSKILLHEPQMAQRFAGRSWWPREPESAEDLLDAFHQFVAALRVGLIDDELPHLDTSMDNPHWDPQTAVLGEVGMNLDHVGRLERMDEVMQALNDHLRTLDQPEVRAPGANRSSLPPPPAIGDAEDRDTVMRLYRRDLEVFDYEPGMMDLESTEFGAWGARVEPLLPMVRTMMAHNQRFRFVYETGRAAGKQLVKETKRLQGAQGQAERRGAQIDRLRSELDRKSTQLERLHHELAQDKSELESVRSELAGARTQNQKMRERVESLTSRRDALLERKAQLEKRVAQLEETNTTLRATYGLVRAVADDKVARLAHAESKVADLESRVTWRMTKPFRKATDVVRSLRRKGRFAKLESASGSSARTPATPKGPSK